MFKVNNEDERQYQLSLDQYDPIDAIKIHDDKHEEGGASNLRSQKKNALYFKDNIS